MPSSRYNQIPHIDDQDIPSTSQLLGIGEIIVRHNLESHFGVHLLHRHFKIHQDTIIFKSVEGEKEVASMTNLSNLDDEKIRPQCFLFDRGAGFLSYEYAYDDEGVSIIPEPLAMDLMRHFTQNDIGHLLAIEKINGNAERLSREYPHGEFATFRMQVDEDKTLDINTDTAWIFRKLPDGSVAPQTTCYWRAGC